MKEIIVIGSGIIGSFLAHELAHYDVHVTVLERRHDICEEVSSANSAIIHTGYDPKDDTLKARLNKRGADLYPTICKQLQVAYQRVGAVVVACGEQEEQELEVLYQRGLRRGVDVQYVDMNVLRKREPHLAQGVSKAMEAKDTAIVTPWEVANALIDEFLLNGGTLKLDEEVIDMKLLANTVKVVTKKASYEADLVINAAGLGAQKIMEMVEDTPLFEMHAKRGQYFILSKQAKDFVQQIIYPTPTKAGKGVLAVPSIHGNILLGPNSEEIMENDTSTTAMGLAEVKTKLAKTLSDVPYQEVIHTYSGIRPCGNHGDFFIDFSHKTKHIIHLGCIDSPGLASAPAIAEYVMQEFILSQLSLKRKAVFVHRKKEVCMQACSLEEKKQHIEQQPAYGHIICRCEKISEQEIVDCIHRPCGARSIKGVKKRVRPGMGKCQGGFCEVEVAKILARELQIPLCEVCYDEDSYYTLSKKGEAA